ncbi:MAG: MerR family transcriptional regulator [Coxiellaceae bacterium]|nr:MerR family transcriptional regulator [Coxiellaceae bacterium]
MSSQKSKRIEAESWTIPDIPDKVYFTIGEVAKLCNLKPHVLRYWEQEFPQLSPTKRRGNRRYYQRKDVELVFMIKTLLYQQGFTIEGARQQITALRKQSSAAKATGTGRKEKLKTAVADLERLLGSLEEV